MDSSYEMASICYFFIIGAGFGSDSFGYTLDPFLSLTGVLKSLASSPFEFFLAPHFPFYALTAFLYLGPPVESSNGVFDSNKAGVLS